jgi:phosphate transport system substrate-binding protein
MTVQGIEQRLAVSAQFVALMMFVSGCVVKTTPVSTGTGSNSTGVSQAGSPSVEPDTEPSSNSGNQKGSPEKAATTINAEGSSTVYPICQAFAVEFEKKSTHKLSVGMQGTGGGYKKFINHQADIWNASRAIDPKEVDELKAKGIEWIELHIAVDGIVIAVNPKNTWCSNLTCAQLKQIWEPNSDVTSWRQIDSSFPDEPIQLYGADTDSGTFEYFTEVINGKKKATNTRYTPASNDNILVQGIASNKGALGYIPFGYYIENTDKLKAVAISPPVKEGEQASGFVEPTVETILSQEYRPLARPLFMYVNKESLKRPEVADFLKYVVSPESQPLVEKRGFVRLTEEGRAKSVQTLDEALRELHAVK